LQHSAPPLFRQGIPALLKLIVCLSISIALMLIDFRFKALDPIRNNVNWVLRPLEYVMLMPRNFYEASSEYMPFSSQLDFLGNPVPYWYYISGNNGLIMSHNLKNTNL
jgi:rod shape-determining protein MreC